LCFHARNVPSIGIETYLQRILKYCPVTNDVFISLLVYFDRMSRKLASQSSEADAGTKRGDRSSGAETKGFAIDSYNVHRLVIAGITISSKFHSDVFYTNSRYAKVGGLPQTELNQLELQFLLLNDFHLMIPLDEMQQY
ncbi:cyclin PHO80-like protein, partial [Filobasidium floriforme]|uniref:cyclin PHO80-like protein n=1 Tax=Filobasidium floriforme TaxID=5210 RepID=UPI001E8E787B